ncbi:MAG: fructose-bisphosphate aldolase [Gammaproteobacteria bacterium]|nr:fructose-bisphosphate aldolase [Gammaproteobacteria bacterium]
MSDSPKTLAATIERLTAKGKGILAADESLKTIQKRFTPYSIECTDATRRDYRQMLFTPADLGQYISGVILYEETLFQKSSEGVPLPKLLEKQGITPGIKVDLGLIDLAGSNGEKITEGLDGLAARLERYKAEGALFAKWRAVFNISNGKPTRAAIQANAHSLARYAAICQSVGIVPIVEPEVLMDGDHDLRTSAYVTEKVLNAVFTQLKMQRVSLEHMILKPSMVIPGTDAATASLHDVAKETLKVLLRTVPAAVPGIFFLSGGQSESVATAHLNEMNKERPFAPWTLSFSYGRALQHSSLETWAGVAANVAAAQAVLLKRARLNSQACVGQYNSAEEK